MSSNKQEVGLFVCGTYGRCGRSINYVCMVWVGGPVGGMYGGWVGSNIEQANTNLITLLRDTPVLLTMSASDNAAAIASLTQTISDLKSDSQNFWLLWAGALVFSMQVGFMCLEVGSVRMKNTKNILLKVSCF